MRLVRRDLVVCPPFWLLPRIETGDSFLKRPAVHGCCRAPAGRCACMGILGSKLFSEVWGIPFCLSLTAPLYYQTIVAFLCGIFEQIENISHLLHSGRWAGSFSEDILEVGPRRKALGRDWSPGPSEEKAADTPTFDKPLFFTRQKIPWRYPRCAWHPWHTSPRRSSPHTPGSARHRPP